MKFAHVSTRLNCEPWMILPTVHQQLQDMLSARIAGVRASMLDDVIPEREPVTHRVQDGVAVVPVKGIISREISDMEAMCGGYDLNDLHAMLAAASIDPNVRAVVLDIDSPGGTVTGVEEAGNAIRAMSKPTISHTSGMAASAGYWLASQARAVYASESANIGSVGVYMAILDKSRAYDAQGVRVDVIRSSESPLKGAGIPGTSLSDDQRAHAQAQVDYLYGRFAAAIKARRPSVKSDALKGGTFYGSQARAVGLVDSIASIETAIRDAARLAKG